MEKELKIFLENLAKTDPDVIKAELCRKDFFEFVKEFWDTVCVDPMIANWHIPYICEELQKVAERVFAKDDKSYDLLINVPPGSSKSTICSQLFPVWLWVNAPWIRLISTAYSMDASLPHSLKSRDCMRSEKFRKWYGKEFEFKRDNDNKKVYENTAGGQRITTSTDGSITSKHAHIILIDDPHKPPNPKRGEAGADPHEIITGVEWHNSTLSTRKTDKAKTVTICIMQRLHEKDLSGDWLEKQKRGTKVKHICIPAELDENIKPLELKDNYKHGLFDPIRLNRDVLNESLVYLGSIGYAGQMQQRPAPAEGEIIKAKWFKKFNIGDIPQNTVRNWYTDGAYGKEKSDNSATICYSVLNNNLYIWDIWVGNYPFPDFIKGYKNNLVRNLYDSRSRCYFEPKATGIACVQVLRSERLEGYNFPIINVMEDEAPVDAKETRISGAAPFVEAGHVYLLENAAWIDPFLHECTIFPNGSHDDQIDCLASIIKKVQTGSSASKIFVGSNYQPKSY